MLCYAFLHVEAGSPRKSIGAFFLLLLKGRRFREKEKKNEKLIEFFSLASESLNSRDLDIR